MIVLGDFHACGSTELWSQGYSEKLQVGVQCPPRAKKAGNTGIASCALTALPTVISAAHLGIVGR